MDYPSIPASPTVRWLSLFSFTPITSPGAPVFTEFAKIADSVAKCESIDGCDHPVPVAFNDCGGMKWQPLSYAAVPSGTNSFYVFAAAREVSECGNPQPVSRIYVFSVTMGPYQEIWPEDIGLIPSFAPLPSSFPNDTAFAIQSVARNVSNNSYIVTYRLDPNGPTPSSIYRLRIPSGIIERLPDTTTRGSLSVSGSPAWTLLQDLNNVEGARLVRSDQLAGTTVSLSGVCVDYYNRLNPPAIAVGLPSTPYYAGITYSNVGFAGPWSVTPDSGQVRLYTPEDLPSTNPRTVFKHDTLAPFRVPGGLLDGVPELTAGTIGPMTYNPATDEFTTIVYLDNTASPTKYVLISTLSQADLAHVAAPDDDWQNPQTLAYTPTLDSFVVSTRSQTPTAAFATLQAMGENPATSDFRDIWLAIPFATAAPQESVRLSVQGAASDCIPAALSHYRFATLPGGFVQPESISASLEFSYTTPQPGFTFTMSRNGSNTFGLVRLATNSPNDYVVEVENLGPVPAANGDANADGVLDVSDVTMIYNVVAGIVVPPLPGDGDVDNNGLIETLDAELLIEHFVNGAALPP